MKSISTNDADLIGLLSLFNSRVRQAQLPAQCEVALLVSPEDIRSELVARGLFLPGWAKSEGLVRSDSGEPLLAEVMQMNLRDFLHAIVMLYKLEVRYTLSNIQVGYGLDGSSTCDPERWVEQAQCVGGWS